MTPPSPESVAAAVERFSKMTGVSEQGRSGLLWTIFESTPFNSPRIASFANEQDAIEYLKMAKALAAQSEELAQARKDVERLDKQLGKFTEVNHQPDRVIDSIAYAALQQEQKTTVPLCPACQSPLLHESFQLSGTWLKVIRAYCVNKRCPSESARDGAAGMTPDEAMRFLIQVVNQDLRWQKQTTPPEGPAPAPTSQ